MGSKAEPEPNSTPKLSLFSLPNQSPEPPGMLTPPLRPPASVPFLWEEAPGKPRTCCDNPRRSDTARCLELPPRLLTEVKITNIPSPTTVLEGPYIVGRSSSFSASFGRESTEKGGQVVLGHSKRENYKEKGGGYFGSWGKRTFKGNGQVAEDSFVISPYSSSFSSVIFSDAVGGGGGGGGGSGGGGGENTKVKITRFRRRGSFLSLTGTSSHLWASIYGTFKQVVVPWRSRRMKKEESRDHNFLTV